MELKLVRTNLTEKSTEGEILIGEAFECFTLELPVKDGLPGSAIPPGKYLVSLLPSPKFLAIEQAWVKQYANEIPHLLGIPHRSDILIHWGNTPHDTKGCIIVGETASVDFIGNSRNAFDALWPKLKAAKEAGEVISIEVIGGIPQAVELNMQGDV